MQFLLTLFVSNLHVNFKEEMHFLLNPFVSNLHEETSFKVTLLYTGLWYESKVAISIY